LSDFAPSSPHRSRCPQCGSRVKRVLRTENDKRRWDADDFRRYRCRSDHCNWQGLLMVDPERRAPAGGGRGGSVIARAGRFALGLLLAAGLAWAGMVALQAMLDP